MREQHVLVPAAVGSEGVTVFSSAFSAFWRLGADVASPADELAACSPFGLKKDVIMCVAVRKTGGRARRQ